MGAWLWFPGVALTTTFLLLLFPHSRLPSRRWRPVAWLASLGLVLGVLALSVAPWDLLGVPAENPFGIKGSIAIVLLVSALVLWAASNLLCVAALFLRLKRSRGEERQQLKWFAYAGALTVTSFFISLVPSLFYAGNALQILTTPLLPVAAGVAILRYRLYDIDRVINLTLVYGLLTATLALVYVGNVVLLQGVFVVLTGSNSQLAGTGDDAPPARFAVAKAA